MLNLEKIYQAQEIIKDTIIETPVLKENHLDTDTEVFLKCENLQVSGSFKIRGATYFMSQLTQEEKERGVIAWSAGNHAQGVALAAQSQNIPATICIPKSGSVSKIEQTKNYGAKVVLTEGVFDDAMRKAMEIQAEENSLKVPPFDHEDIVIGQATIGLEILDQLDDLDAVVVPIGGGGLIAGIAYVIKTLKPECKVYGVEAEGAASMKYALDHDKLEPIHDVNTIADGIAVKHPGELNYNLVKEYVDEVFTVSDYEISEAMLHLLEKDHLVAEGAGASAFAAIKFNKIPKHKKVACMVSGGNIDVELLNRVVAKALYRQKRIVQFNVVIQDTAGSLNDLISIVSKNNGNIISVRHNRLDTSLQINESLVQISFEVSKKEDVTKITEKIKANGYKVKE